MESSAIIQAAELWSGVVASVVGAAIAIRIIDWALGVIRDLNDSAARDSDSF